MKIFMKALAFVTVVFLFGCVTTSSSLSSIKVESPAMKWNQSFTEYSPRNVAWVRLIDLGKMIGIDFSSSAFSTMNNPAKTFR